MDRPPRLSDEHLARARQMVAQHQTASTCKLCYGRGYRGVNQNNMLIPCSKCVDTDALQEAWKAHVRETPELVALYGDFFEDEEETQD